MQKSFSTVPTEIGKGAMRALLATILLASVLEVLSLTLGFPSVREIALAGFRQAKSGMLAHDIAVSLARWAIGYVPGLVFGVALGLLTGRVSAARFVFEWFFIYLRGVPFIALAPLILFVFNIEESGKFFFVGWVTFTVSWIIVHRAALDLPERTLWRLQVLDIPKSRKLIGVLIPSISGQIRTAVHTSLAIAFIVVAVAEWSGVYERSSGRWWSEGLGYRIWNAYKVSDLDTMMSSVVILAAIGLLLDLAAFAIWEVLAYLRHDWLAHRVLRDLGGPGLASAPPRQNGKETLAIENLSASYGRAIVVHDASFTVPAGETHVIVGPSGNGKTTLLRGIARFMSQDFRASGRVTLGETPIDGPCAKIGVVFQDAAVFEHMTVWDHALFGLANPTPGDKRRVKEMLDRFGLLKSAHRLSGELSGGQRQRLAIASALAYRPTLLLLDEPFGALDAYTRRNMQEFYWENVKGRITAIFITHGIDEAILIGDTVRVGIRTDSPVLRTGSQLAPEVREFTPEFTAAKKELADAIVSESVR